MRWKAVVDRLDSLPALHRALPAALAGGVFAVFWAYVVFAPPIYVTTAVVDFHNVASMPNSTVLDATVLAESILRSTVQESRLAWSDGNDLALRPWRSKTQVAISRISSSKLRLILRGRESVSTEAASRVLIGRLTGWSPPGECIGDGCAVKPQNAEIWTSASPGTLEHAEVEHGSPAAREIAMLRFTLRLLDQKIGAASSASERVAARGDVSEPRRRLEMQRGIVSMRLAQELAEAGAKKSRRQGSEGAIPKSQAKETRYASGQKAPRESTADDRDATRATERGAASGALVTSPRESFRLVSQDSGMAPAGESALGNLSVSVLISMMVGCLYLAVALWWFRPVGDLQELRSLVPPQVPVFSSAGKHSR